jgi:hypothetical protein
MTIGAESHVPTYVNLNSVSDIEAHIKNLIAKIDAYTKDEIRITQFFARVESLKKQNRVTAIMALELEKAVTDYKQLQADRAQAKIELEEAKLDQLNQQQSLDGSYISCRGYIHAGVSIQIGPLIHQVNRSSLNNRVQIIDGDIKFMNN